MDEKQSTLSEGLATVSETLNAILEQSIEVAGPSDAEENCKPEAGCVVEELHCSVEAIQYKVHVLQVQMDRIYKRL